LTQWLESQDCELLNNSDEFTYTNHSGIFSSVIDLTFTTSAMLAFVKNWQIDEEMTTESDHEVIHFTISTKEAEMVESSLNSSYNTAKADWTNFAKQLCQNSEKILNLANNSNSSLTHLENIAISFRNLIADAANQHIPKQKPFIKAKVWWHDDLNALRKSMSLAKRN